jgi:RNA polymerase sigma-70 factor, ECF subfamily
VSSFLRLTSFFPNFHHFNLHNPVKQEDDKALLASIKNDNKLAFDILFRKYYTPLSRFAFKLNGSEAAAEEAVQEVFINFWEHRHHLEVSKAVLSYLFQAVRNKVYEQYRKVQTRAKYEEEYVANIPEHDEQQEVDLSNYEIACMVWTAVEKLPEKCKEIFQLSRDEGLTYNEIAAHLNISYKTVENQMGIAFKKLREILTPAMKSKNKITQVGMLLLFSMVYFLFLIVMFYRSITNTNTYPAKNQLSEKIPNAFGGIKAGIHLLNKHQIEYGKRSSI